MWGTARCPVCGETISQWDARPTGGWGGVTFESETGRVDLSDVFVTNVDLFCPTIDCTFKLENVSESDLEEWFKKYKLKG